ncbi:hypothetical protein C0989_003168 [Termitomyces sp. Mn162]|nr:hypothetical protein C0989_003168 [Termitomyces sp. Mn162]
MATSPVPSVPSHLLPGKRLAVALAASKFSDKHRVESDESTATVTGTSFQVVNGAGTYIIYSLSGAVSLTASNTGTIVAGAQFKGVLRVVKLNSPSHKAILDQYVANYPTGVSTDYDFNGDVGTLRFTWTVTGNAANLLMLTWPHHRCVPSHKVPVQLLMNTVS